MTSNANRHRILALRLRGGVLVCVEKQGPTDVLLVLDSVDDRVVVCTKKLTYGWHDDVIIHRDETVYTGDPLRTVG
jgi:hypothetical protein